MISLLPGRVIKLLEFIGFSGDKVKSISSVLCAEKKKLFHRNYQFFFLFSIILFSFFFLDVWPARTRERLQ